MKDVYLLVAHRNSGAAEETRLVHKALSTARELTSERGVRLYPLTMNTELTADMRYYGDEEGTPAAVLFLLYTPASFTYPAFERILLSLSERGTKRVECLFIETPYVVNDTCRFSSELFGLGNGTDADALLAELSAELPSGVFTVDGGDIYVDGKRIDRESPDPEIVPFLFVDGEGAAVKRSSRRSVFKDGDDYWLNTVSVSLPRTSASADAHIDAADRRLSEYDYRGASAELTLASEVYSESGLQGAIFMTVVIDAVANAVAFIDADDLKMAIKCLDGALEKRKLYTVGAPEHYRAILRIAARIRAIAYWLMLTEGDYSLLESAVKALEEACEVGYDMRTELAFALTNQAGEDYTSDEEFSCFSARANAEAALEIYETLIAEGKEIDRSCYDSVRSILGIK